jgi:hypothetical protein
MKIPTLLCLAALLGVPGLAAQSHLLVVSGAGGEPGYADEFHAWGTAMVDAARDRFNLAPERIVYLAENPARDPARISGRSTKEEVEKRLRHLARSAGPGDRVLVLLIGHGSSDTRGARINLPGPDISAAELASLLDLFTTQRVVVVNAASASGDFHGPLASANRTVITATRSGLERNATVFARFFVEAFRDDVADADRDGRVTVLEAFDYAVREVERFYASQNRLQTEHPRLEGSRELARSFHLAGSPTAAAAATSPELERLHTERQRLESELEALRARRSELDAGRYEAELERLLVEIALKSREIREREGSR